MATTRRPEDQERLDRFGTALRGALASGGRIRTQDALAAALGVKQTTVSTWVTGKKAPRQRSTVEDIERALGPGVCPPGTLQLALYGGEGLDPEPGSLPTPREIVGRIRRLLDELDRHLDADDGPGQPASALGARSAATLRSVAPRTPGTGTRGKRHPQ